MKKLGPAATYLLLVATGVSCSSVAPPYARATSYYDEPMGVQLRVPAGWRVEINPPAVAPGRSSPPVRELLVEGPRGFLTITLFPLDPSRKHLTPAEYTASEFTLHKTDRRFSLTRDVFEHSVGDREFLGMEFMGDLGSGPIPVTGYLFRANQLVLILALRWNDDSARREVEGVFDSLHLDSRWDE